MASLSSLLDTECVARFEHWVHHAKRGDVMLIKAGATGCGISTMIQSTLEAGGCEPLHVISRLQRVKEYVADASLSSHTALQKKKKIIVMDPIDALFSDQGSVVDIIDLFRNPRKGSNLPTICAGFVQRSTFARVVDAIGKHPYTLLEFPRIETPKALRFLKSVYGTTHGDAALETTWTHAHGDLRACCVALDFGGNVTHHHVKDVVCDGMDAMRKILFHPVTLEEAIRLHDGDSQLLHMGVFENYGLANPDIDVCVQIADAFAAADIVEEHVYGNQEYDLLEFYAFLSAGVAGVLLPSPARPPVIGKVGTLWSRINNQRSKQKSLREIRHSLQEGSSSLSCVHDLATLRTALTSLSRQQRWEDMIRLAGHINDSTILSIIRLFKTNYTQVDHSKFKKARTSHVTN